LLLLFSSILVSLTSVKSGQMSCRVAIEMLRACIPRSSTLLVRLQALQQFEIIETRSFSGISGLYGLLPPLSSTQSIPPGVCSRNIKTGLTHCRKLLPGVRNILLCSQSTKLVETRNIIKPKILHEWRFCFRRMKNWILWVRVIESSRSDWQQLAWMESWRLGCKSPRSERSPSTPPLLLSTTTRFVD